MLTQMVGLRCAHLIWDKLKVYYASHTRTKIRKLKLQLKTPKRDHSIYAYILDIKKVVNSLAATDFTISYEYHIDVVLDGLPEEYDAFITSITSRLDPYTVENIEALILSQEERFEKHRSLANSLILANVAYTNWSSSPSSTFVFRGNNVHGGHEFFRSNTNSRGHQSSRDPHSSWIDQSFSTTSVRVQCQLCFKYGHTTLTCWTRSDTKMSSQIYANTTFFTS